VELSPTEPQCAFQGRAFASYPHRRSPRGVRRRVPRRLRPRRVVSCVARWGRTALLFLFDDVLPGIIDRSATRIAEASRVA